jgi:hypothetical protein
LAKPQAAERLVEPNSGLGKAISYPLNRWTRLTLFFKRPGSRWITIWPSVL